MASILFLSVLLSTCAFTWGHSNRTSDGEVIYEETITDNTIPSSIGSAVGIVLIACLIYCCCCRKRSNDGFSRFNNDNDDNPPRGRSRRRRWFRRNRHQNYNQNNVDPRQPTQTQVIIQPVVAVGIPTDNPNFGAPGGGSGVAPGMPTAPPGYDESVNNTQRQSQFVNPPMPNQFMNPPMPNQFMNPPMPNQFMNQPMPGNFNNPPPMPGNFNNPPPMPGNFNNQPPKNPNASSYYTKY